MTLIITALSENAVVQATDRRLTQSDGSLFDDLAIKTICVSCADANFRMSYTGLATIRGQRTDECIVNYLSSINAGQLHFMDILASLKRYLAAIFRELYPLGRIRGITIAIAGFGPSGPFMAFLSNMEDGRGNWLSEIDDNFQVGVFLRNDKLMRKLDLVINGAENTVEVFGMFTPQVRKRYSGKDPERIAIVLVQLIRKAADHPKFGHLIGRNCISVVVKPTDGFLCQDYPEKASPQQYVPHLIFPGTAYKDIKIWTGEGTPPWWSRNRD